MSITASSILETGGTKIEPQIVTIDELLKTGTKMIGRFVKIKDVKLGTFTDKNTVIMKKQQPVSS